MSLRRRSSRLAGADGCLTRGWYFIMLSYIRIGNLGFGFGIGVLDGGICDAKGCEFMSVSWCSVVKVNPGWSFVNFDGRW